MQINRKLLGLGCATLGITIITTVALASVALKQQDKKDINQKVPSCHNGYDHEEISSFIDRNYLSKKCVIVAQDDNKLKIDEQRLRENVNDILRFALKKMNQFANNYDKYTIEVNYHIVYNVTLDIDAVWYLPGTNPHKYYDQFEISLAI
jgi:hypothetical protein